jgi:hypothetical protein
MNSEGKWPQLIWLSQSQENVKGTILIVASILKIQN